MGFIVETSFQGLFLVTEEPIHHYALKNESESKGILVRRHFDDVHKTLWVANFIKEGNVFESKYRYGVEPDEPSAKSPPLLSRFDYGVLPKFDGVKQKILYIAQRLLYELVAFANRFRETDKLPRPTRSVWDGATETSV